MYKTGVLLLTTHVQQLRKGDTLQKILLHVKKYVSSTLYVHMTKVGPDISGKQLENVNDLYSQSRFSSSLIPFISDFYKTAALECKDMNVNILVHNIGYEQSKNNLIKHTFPDPLQCVLCDIPSLTMEKHMSELQSFISKSYASPKRVSTQCSAPLLSIHCDDAGILRSKNDETVSQYNEMCKKEAVVLGGTFDNIHIGHKILLTEALLLAKRKVVIGVSNGPLLKQKILKELILPVEQRIEDLRTFLSTVGNVKSTSNKNGKVELNLVEILDPYGPSIVDPDLQAIVVSKETVKGGKMVNDKRKINSLSHLDMHVINNGKLLDLPATKDEAGHLNEVKISSSTMRYEKLGKLLKPINAPVMATTSNIQPYVVGLTGGIASGKTSVASRLSELGASMIDCDKLGHSSYLPGTNGFANIVKEFGAEVVNPTDGFIDRKKLGALVFGDKDNLSKLNRIVWPEIENLAKQQINTIVKEKKLANGHEPPIVFLDAAVLLEAEWNKFCDEVWVVMVPEEEALSRLMKRNNMNEKAANERIKSQLSNMDRIKQANVVLSTLWEPNVTQTQVEKAWKLLSKRLQGQASEDSERIARASNL